MHKILSTVSENSSVSVNVRVFHLLYFSSSRQFLHLLSIYYVSPAALNTSYSKVNEIRLISCPRRVHSLRRQTETTNNFPNSRIPAKIQVGLKLSDRIEARVILSPGESQRNFHKDIVDCVPLKGTAGEWKDSAEGKPLESRRCEKAWGQELASARARVSDPGGQGI